MTRFFKSAAFPIIIVIILAFFASKLISNSDRAEKTTFATFLTQLASTDTRSPDHIKSVTLDTKDNSVEVTRVDGKKYEIGYPSDYAGVLVNKLQSARDADRISDFDVRPAFESSPEAPGP